MGDKLVSVVTCVYNRADKIERVFRSVNNQTYPNIEHIIVDDGSTDNVLELIENYRKDAKYPVTVTTKSNGGKHTATNVAWDLAKGDYILQLDSDDELLPHAVEYLVGLYDEIPDESKEQYWCVHGRCRTQHSEDIVGDMYPSGINSLSFDESYNLAKKCKGDKVGLMKAKILKEGNYRYPEPQFVKFVTESVVWKQLNKKFRTWYSNEIVYIYYTDEGECLSRPIKNQQNMSNKCWNYRWVLVNRREYPCNLIKSVLGYIIAYAFALPSYKKHWNYLFVSPKDDFVLACILIILYIPINIFKPFIRKKLNIRD